MKSGFLLIHKPSGPTSFDIIYQLRKITGIKKIGHAGTLDPFASGLLIIAIGEATKVLRHYIGMDKTYVATLRLGATSDTYDRTGEITNNQSSITNKITKTKIEKVLKSFEGKQKQLPPMHSAKKVGGTRLYKLARKGEEIERKKIDIEVSDICMDSFKDDLLTITCTVSSGTYIRTLAHDIGQALGCGAYVEELKRTSIGDFALEDAITIDPKKTTKEEVEKYVTPLKTVIVSGTFDGVHEGHKNYFQQARTYGHRLVCIIGRASVVKRIKGAYPKNNAKERIALVKACPEIDQVYLGIDGSDDEVFDFVASLKPDVIALGYDQTAYTENLEKEMKKRGVDVEVKTMQPFHPETYKNSKIKKRPE